MTNPSVPNYAIINYLGVGIGVSLLLFAAVALAAYAQLPAPKVNVRSNQVVFASGDHRDNWVRNKRPANERELKLTCDTYVQLAGFDDLSDPDADSTSVWISVGNNHFNGRVLTKRLEDVADPNAYIFERGKYRQLTASDRLVRSGETICFPGWTVRLGNYLVKKDDKLIVISDESNTQWITVVRDGDVAREELRVSTTDVRLTKPEFQAIQIMVIGVLLIASSYWQYKLCSRDRAQGYPRRMIPAAIVAAAMLVGCFGYGLISTVNGKQFGWDEMLAKCAVLAILLCAKSYLGPLLVSYVVGTQVWFVFEYLQFQPVPLLSETLDWVFDFGPEWLATVYLLFSTAYSLGGSAWDSYFPESVSLEGLVSALFPNR